MLDADVTELPLWVRIGLHWGQQTVRRPDLVGHDVNVAARIVDVAGPGEVLLSPKPVEPLGDAVVTSASRSRTCGDEGLAGAGCAVPGMALSPRTAPAIMSMARRPNDQPSHRRP